MKSKKGGQYEREFCRALSLWWSTGTRDDIFWRTAGSGGRATVRSKQNRRTFGQYGDIQAVDPVGAPLMRVICVELKRGYNKATLADALDRAPCMAQQQWEAFAEQAQQQAEHSGAPYWLLVQKRDDRHAIAFFPRALYVALEAHLGGPWAELRPLLSFRATLRRTKGLAQVWIYAVRLADFFRLVTPRQIRDLDNASRNLS